MSILIAEEKTIKHALRTVESEYPYDAGLVKILKRVLKTGKADLTTINKYRKKDEKIKGVE